MRIVQAVPVETDVELFREQPDVSSVPKVAELLGVSKQTVYRLIDRGELRAVHVGRAVRILKTDLVSYLTKEVNR